MARSFASASSQYLNLGSAIVSGPPFTMACWYRRATESSFGLMSVSSASDNYWTLNAASGIVQAEASNVSGSSASSGSSESAGSWNHACGVFDGDSSRFAYLNGTVGSEDTNTITPDAPSETYIGAVAGSSTMNGDIADAAIWSTYLSAAEVGMLAAGYSPLMVRPDALVAYWPLLNDDNDFDWWAQNHLTENASPTYAQHPPIIYPSGPIWTVGGAGGGGGVATIGAGLTRSNLLQRMRLVG